ncbi:unnamed protein product [Arctogadus glacialis]
MSGRIRVGVTTVTGGGPLSSAQVAISHLQAGLVVPRCPQHRDRSRRVKTAVCQVGDLVMSGRIRVGVTTVTGGGPLSSAQVAISHLQAGLVVPRCPQHRDRSRRVKTAVCQVGDLVMSGRIRVGVTTVTGGGPLSSAQVLDARAHLLGRARGRAAGGGAGKHPARALFITAEQILKLNDPAHGRQRAERTVEKDRGRNARAVRAAWVFDLASSRLSRAVMTST